MSNEWVRRCFIVPAEYAPLARALCAGIVPENAGAGMFAVPLSSTGNPPPSYFITHGMIKKEFAVLLPLTSFDETGVPTNVPGQPETIVALSQGAVTLAQVTALLNAVSVTDEEPFVAMAKLGLKLIQEEL